jgi:protein phosphatase
MRLFKRDTTDDTEATGSDQASTAPLDPAMLDQINGEVFPQHFISGASLAKGSEHNINDDAVLTLSGGVESSDELPDFGLYCVADGVSGQGKGAQASSIAVRSVAHSLTKAAYLHMIIGDPEEEVDPVEDLVRAAIERANRMVRSQAKGGATTMTLALMMGDQMTIGQVGDSRAYLIEEDRFEQLTTDHSVLQRLIDTGVITEKDAEDHPQKNVLWNALGKEIEVNVEVSTHAIPRGGYLLLCSDGLWDVLPQDHIRERITNLVQPQMICEQLVADVVGTDAADDVSVVLVQFPA